MFHYCPETAGWHDDQCRILPPYRIDEYYIVELYCDDDIDDSLVASPKSCQHYFQCSNGQELVCPVGEAFDEKQQKGQPEDQVDCVLCPEIGEHELNDPDCHLLH